MEWERCCPWENGALRRFRQGSQVLIGPAAAEIVDARLHFGTHAALCFSFFHSKTKGIDIREFGVWNVCDGVGGLIA